MTDKLEFLYTWPEIGYTSQHEAALYRGDPIEQPEPRRFKVVNVTNRFVYIIDKWERKYRLDRAKVESNQAISHKRLSSLVYTWDAVKDRYEETRHEWARLIARKKARIASEYELAEKQGYHCARCGRKCKGLAPAQYQNRDGDLAVIKWHFPTKWDGQLTCYSCRREIFKENLEAKR